jgi:acyl-CoA thioesterase
MKYMYPTKSQTNHVRQKRAEAKRPPVTKTSPLFFSFRPDRAPRPQILAKAVIRWKIIPNSAKIWHISAINTIGVSKLKNDTNSKNLTLAHKVADEMLKLDKHAQYLGMQVNQISPGYAELSLVVREDMVNGLGICHGGVTFSLADTAFAFACNSRNNRTLALNCSITYSAPARSGDVLTAVAQETVLNGKTGVYDVIISNQHMEKIALFRGVSYRTRQQIVNGSADE